MLCIWNNDEIWSSTKVYYAERQPHNAALATLTIFNDELYNFLLWHMQCSLLALSHWHPEANVHLKLTAKPQKTSASFIFCFQDKKIINDKSLSRHVSLKQTPSACIRPHSSHPQNLWTSWLLFFFFKGKQLWKSPDTSFKKTLQISDGSSKVCYADNKYMYFTGTVQGSLQEACSAKLFCLQNWNLLWKNACSSLSSKRG